jgi:integrase
VRKVAVPKFLAELLTEHLAAHVAQAPDAFLFVGRTGKALRYGSWKRWKFDPAVRAAGLTDVTPHSLRATHGTWVADSHGVMAAARRLGHSNANVTTRHYARAVDGRDAEIAADFDVQRAKRAEADTHGESKDVARGSHEGVQGEGSKSDDQPANGL